MYISDHSKLIFLTLLVIGEEILRSASRISETLMSMILPHPLMFMVLPHPLMFMVLPHPLMFMVLPHPLMFMVLPHPLMFMVLSHPLMFMVLPHPLMFMVPHPLNHHPQVMYYMCKRKGMSGPYKDTLSA